MNNENIIFPQLDGNQTSYTNSTLHYVTKSWELVGSKVRQWHNKLLSQSNCKSPKRKNLTCRLCLRGFYSCSLERCLEASVCLCFWLEMSDRRQMWAFHSDGAVLWMCVFIQKVDRGSLDRAGEENPPCRGSVRLKATHVSQRRKMEV